MVFGQNRTRLKRCLNILFCGKYLAPGDSLQLDGCTVAVFAMKGLRRVLTDGSNTNI